MYKDKTKLFFIGMGLSGLRSCTLETLDILKKVDQVFIERYTNFVPKKIHPSLNQIKSKITLINRQDLEENDNTFLENIEGKTTAILISGDPFVATTHNSLRIAAIQRGFLCQVIHNTSIISAACSVSGLSSYRFGRVVTCPFSQNPSDFPYEIIKRNKQIEAHTLVLLDIDLNTEDFLPIDEAITIFLKLEEKKKEIVFNKKSIVIGLAQIGTKSETIYAGTADRVMKYPWKEIGPPQALIVCSESFHFTEEEALKTLWCVDLRELFSIE